MTTRPTRRPQVHGDGDVLYNGIRLPATWPPRTLDPMSIAPVGVPYLASPPPVIPIDVGRQLFVDDFLIESTTLQRTFHHATKYEGNPILKPETRLESCRDHAEAYWRPASGAQLFDDAVIYDPGDQRFKLWYECGHRYATALAYSGDGLRWERPTFDVLPGTNGVIPYEPDFKRDSFSPWLDFAAADPSERFKAFFYARSKDLGDGGWLCTSPDGIHWTRISRTGGPIGDNTSLFYNPFRRRWALSIRRNVPGRERVRYYWESADFHQLARFAAGDPVYWTGADRLDPPDPDVATEPGAPGLTQLYAVAPVAYESLMLGVFTIHYGPHNNVCDEGRFPKLTQLKLGFSRDGFHWHRPDRELFIAATKRHGDWDGAYLRAAGGGCLVVGDRLYFYYCGFSGLSPTGERHMYAGGSSHVAFLRRDGFASLDAGDEPGWLTTRPVSFTGTSLFVNVNAPYGELRVEILDADGQVLPPYSIAACAPLSADSTKAPIRWPGAEDLSMLRGRPVKFRFRLVNGRFYACWVSPDRTGASNGYVAAGGPGFGGSADAAGPSGD